MIEVQRWTHGPGHLVLSGGQLLTVAVLNSFNEPGEFLQWFLAHDAFVGTNSRAIAMMFVRLSLCLGRVCIVIIHCTLAQI